ncbi:P-loop containing nucleoside triphosphate hydrolase protein [Annulohypoxylon truncatum]|uniref:P-loop containing nucleoside triphosphate hydrolase protein n=1 Tax=Annulohypoxylon truncatum TaxID=327061 RepID=UPI0020071F3F|nr:P-loop containing nucleoside triphosphate hydrolase protein [Annulohypoxylon truncatum]KAI1206953.1 P-loop containing nucleoside triphosphate hydrolase protein [Annulohypoxylon truncatum]
MDSPRKRWQQREQHSPSLKHLFTFTTWRHCGPLTAGLISALFSGALRTSQAILIGKIFGVISEFGSGQLSGPDTLTQVSSWCVVLTVVGGAGWIVNFAFMFSWILFSELQAKNIRQRIFGAMLRKDMEWFDCREDGVASLLVRMQTQTRELQMASSIALGSLAAEIATSVASLVVAFRGSWKLTLVLLATVPISVAVLAVLSRTLKSAVQAQKQELSRASKYAISAIAAIDLVKAFNANDHETWQYLRAIRRSMNKYLIQARAAACQSGYVKLWLDGMFVIGFYYGVVLVNEGLSPGDVVTTFYAALGAMQAFEAFVPMYMALARGMSAGQALYFVVYDAESGRKMRRMIGNHSPKECFGDIRISDVSFAYPSNLSKVVLNKVSFTFEPGRLYFVVGRSGSGKSTLGNLLLKFYEPFAGDIFIDSYGLKTLDTEWVRNNVTLIQQASVLFNDTFSANVAMGRGDPTRVSRAEVKAACETALLQSTIATLPNGLDTYVGAGGHDLSGGQKQRLALARAKIRDPPVLILDEVTSGLDPVSRSLVMDAVRQWRRGKTTIIVTHEVAQIKDYDFVYVMDDARVIQKGFRKALQEQGDGIFATLAASATEDNGAYNGQVPERATSPPADLSYQKSASEGGRASSNYFWPFETQDDHRYLAQSTALGVGAPAVQARQFLNQSTWNEDADPDVPRAGESASRSMLLHLRELGDTVRDSRRGRVFEDRRSGLQASDTSAGTSKSRIDHKDIDEAKREEEQAKALPLLAIYKTVWPCLTTKERAFLVIGFVACIAVAGSVPAFSVVFANLLAVLYSSGDKMASGQRWALYLLLIAVAGALSTLASQYLMQWAAQAWVNALRMRAFSRVLRQPKAWFEKPAHSTIRISECMDRNAEEMRNLLGRFAPQLLVVVIMISTTIVWAAVISWRLTLVSLGSAPLLVAATKGYAFVSTKWETRCNRALEKVIAVSAETFLNVRVVRALTLESFFSAKHDASINAAFDLGVRKATWTSTLYASWQSIFWFMMALIFWYATVLLTVNSAITVHDILQVVNLLVLGLTTASNILNSVPSITASQATAAQLLYYANLPAEMSHESTGMSKLIRPFPILMDGLSFTYPSMNRAVLRNVSLSFDTGTSTAIVGPSGCGKSTIASLILGLYVPDTSGGRRISDEQGQLSFGFTDASKINVSSLRSHIGYVPQTPFLFPASLAANIFYGLPEESPLRSLKNLQRAAREAGIYDFVRSLAAGFDTVVGDGGQALSGGQAQRVCIARALARRPKILLLDEPTSALDSESAEAVRRTIEALMRSARTHVDDDRGSFDIFATHRARNQDLCVIVITHSKEMMRTADRVVVIDQGSVVETGSYDELFKRKGKFTELVSDGAWIGGGESPGKRRNTGNTGMKAQQSVSNDLPLRKMDASDAHDSVTTPRWIGLRDTYRTDDRGPSTGLMSPLTSPFGMPSRRKEHRGDGTA